MLSLAFSTRYSSLIQTRLPLQAVSSRLSLFCRRYALASLSDLKTESRTNIVCHIRSIKAKGLTVAWHDLASTYNISEASLKQIVAEDAVEMQKQKELSERITDAAVRPDRFFDKEKSRCNWDALAAEFGLPLVDCLRAYNPAKSPHELRSMPKPVEWLHEDRAMLFSLLRNVFNNSVTTDWKLVGAYMNTTVENCKSAARFLRNPRMTHALFEDIQIHRDNGLAWQEIHSLYPHFTSHISFRDAFSTYKRRVKNTDSSTVWTKIDQQRMLDLISKHRRIINSDEKHVFRLIASEFPHLPEGAVRERLMKKLSNLRYMSFSRSTFNRLRQLISEYGEDWVRIDSELGTPLGLAQYNWGMIKDLKLTETWSLEDTKRLYHCINVGMSVADSVQYIGTKSAAQLKNMKAKLKKQDVVLMGSGKTLYGRSSQWSDERKARLLELAALSNDDSRTTWVNIAKQLGYSEAECIYTYHMLQATDWHPNTVSHNSSVEIVTRICRDEYLSTGCIDWAKVGKLTGLDQRECMEACELDESKRRWIYNADTFQWDDAKRMTDFIKVNYPESSRINYRAVSNYLWVKLEDCIHMHDLLQGKFRWTDDVVNRVAQMRSQGHKFSYIAKQLSPTLSKSRAKNVYNMRFRERKPISEEDKQHIKELVDRYVGKVPVKEVTERVKRELASWDNDISHFVSNSVGNHQNYKKRLAGMDLTNIADRISSGKLTIVQAAAELDVTSTVLHCVLRKLYARGYSSKWTAAETDQLITYVRSLGADKPDWVYCAKLIGTKHYMQCCGKFQGLKKRTPNVFSV